MAEAGTTSPATQPIPGRNLNVLPTVDISDEFEGDLHPLTQAEMGQIEENFNNYIVSNLDELPVDWTIEERIKELSFRYAREQELARFTELMDRPDGRVARFVQQHTPYVRQALDTLRHHVYDHSPFTERVANWARETGIAVGLGYASRIAVQAGVNMAPRLLNLSQITGGPAAWVGGALAGAGAGAAVGFRRGGERYVTENFNACKLHEELQLDELVRQYENSRGTSHQESDPKYLPAGSGQVEAGGELSSDYYAQVAEVVSRLTEILHNGYLRGSHSDKASLINRLAILEAILETKTFFDEQAKRNEEEGSYTALADPGSGQLSHLWRDLQVHRNRHSYADYYNFGVSERAKKFIDDQRREARHASWKGAGAGALTGLVLGGVMSKIFGSHQISTEKVPGGFGGGAVSGQVAMEHAMHDPQFNQLYDLLHNSTQNSLNHLPHETVDQINHLLNSHNLPNLGYYTDQNGQNTLLELAHVSSAGQAGNQTKEALYNFISYFGNHNVHMPTTLQGMANPDNFAPAREVYLSHLRDLGLMQHVVSNVTGPADIASVYDHVTRAAIPGGYLAGELSSRFSTPRVEYSNRPGDKEKFAEKAESVGKPPPAAKQYWEISHGAINYNQNSIHPSERGSKSSKPMIIRIDEIIGGTAHVTVLSKLPRGARQAYEVPVRELIKDKGYKYLPENRVPEEIRNKEKPVSDKPEEKKEAKSQIKTPEQTPPADPLQQYIGQKVNAEVDSGFVDDFKKSNDSIDTTVMLHDQNIDVHVVCSPKTKNSIEQYLAGLKSGNNKKITVKFKVMSKEILDSAGTKSRLKVSIITPPKNNSTT